MTASPTQNDQATASGSGKKSAAAPRSDRSFSLRSSTALPISRYLLYFGLAIGGGAADLISKEAVFSWRGPEDFQRVHWLIEDYVGIETNINPGALFGMGAGYSGLFAGLSIVAGLGILAWLFLFGGARDRWLTTALGMVTGGILGNLYDRLGLWDASQLPAEHQQGVRDWILWCYTLEHKWPNFNIADVLLVTGAIMLGLHAFFFREPSDEQSPADEKRSDQQPSTNDHRGSEKKATASS